MASILEEIATATRTRVDTRMQERPLEQIKQLAERMGGPIEGGGTGTGAYQTFQNAMRKRGLSVVAEIKKAAPDKGVINEDFDYADIAYDFESGDADALTVVTEPHWHYGSREAFADIRNDVCLPLLRHDFVIDPYQIYESKTMGADAVLLSCALLDDEALNGMVKLCDKLRIDAVVEAHSEEEVERAVRSNALLIATNNRDLSDYSLDMDTTARLRKIVPSDCLLISVGGIASIEDAKRLREAGADAVVVGEMLMSIQDPDERQATVREMSEIK